MLAGLCFYTRITDVDKLFIYIFCYILDENDDNFYKSEEKTLTFGV